jgi:hypothetical protein
MSSFFLLLFDLLHVAALAGLVALLARPAWRDAFERRCIGARTAVDLAWVRIVTCAALCLCVASIDLPSQAAMPKTWFAPPGYLAWIGRDAFDWFITSANHLRLVQWATLALLVLAGFGVLTRATVPLALVVYVLFAGLARSFGKEFHAGYLGGYVLLVLCFLPSGDALSWDARRRGAPPPAASYGWGVWACWAAASVPYLQLGFSKLIAGGVYWFEGAALRNYMLTDDLNLTEWNIDLALRSHDAPEVLFTVAGFFALLLELTYAFVLVSPRLRLVIPAGLALLHLGVWFGQDALFPDAVLVPLIFYVPARLRRHA